MHTLTLLFSSLLFSLSTPIIKCFTIDLIHRDSPLSPFYNSSDLLQNAVSRSNRFHLNDDLRTNNNNNNSIPIYRDGEFLMRISIGTPPIQTWAIADTRHDLVWLQCSPCDTCYPQNDALYDPTKSSTYETVSCHSKPCILLPQGQSRCGDSNQCVYNYDYLAMDLINFGGQYGNLSNQRSVFGCGHKTGIIGLGNGPLSLVSQLGPKIGYNRFFYCLVPLTSNLTSKLRLGKNAKISGIGIVSTPFITVPGAPIANYFLNLRGITVGYKTVTISESENGNIMIDLGTKFTFLPTSFYNKVEALVKEAMHLFEAVPNPPEPFKLCYSNQSVTSFVIKYYFPTFEVHFMRGASIGLNPINNLFVPESGDLLCFGMIPTDGVPIYGNLAQINFQVEYDLEERKVFLARDDCTNTTKYGSSSSSQNYY